MADSAMLVHSKVEGGAALFGFPLESGSRREIMYGCLAGAVFMLLATLVEAFLVRSI